MGAEQTLTAPAGPTPGAAAQACPACRESWGALPAVPISGLENVQVRRCGRCGTRATCDRSPQRLLNTCEVCGQPFLHGGDGSSEAKRCPGCRVDAAAPEAPEAQVIRAMETEIRAALECEWRFVTSRAVGRYLDGIVHQVAARVVGAPAACRVAVIDEPALRILALPSGLILLSVGVLRFLDDEAELVFVLGRELAHLARGRTAAGVVRASLRVLAHDEAGRPDTAWIGAMHDILRLGHARHDELEADAAAIRAMLALRYEPRSALNLLVRIKRAIEMGNRDAADVAVAYPPPGYRARKIEGVLYGRIGRAPVQRVNREVFRRVAGPDALRALEAAEIGIRNDSSLAADDGRRSTKLRLWIAGSFLVILLGAIVWLLLRV